MKNIVERLQSGVAALSELQQKRMESGDPKLGYDVEQSIIETELQDLEQDIVCGPDVRSEELLYVRRRRRF